MQHDLLQKKKNVWHFVWPHPGVKSVQKGKSICLYGVLYFIPYNSTTSRKEKKWSSDSTPGVKGECKVMFASMFYASFPSIQ